ncbi:hypothetical protein WMY93_034245, partial [Mugilogobius chulae]
GGGGFRSVSAQTRFTLGSHTVLSLSRAHVSFSLSLSLSLSASLCFYRGRAWSSVSGQTLRLCPPLRASERDTWSGRRPGVYGPPAELGSRSRSPGARGSPAELGPGAEVPVLAVPLRAQVPVPPLLLLLVTALTLGRCCDAEPGGRRGSDSPRVCAYVCVCVCVRLRVCLCLRVCMRLRAFACLCVRLRACLSRLCGFFFSVHTVSDLETLAGKNNPTLKDPQENSEQV